MHLKTDILNSYKPIDEEKIDQLLAEKINAWNKKWVVLDDDPTGIQTVHDISVYTNWKESSLEQGFTEENKLFYILTNSRGLTQSQTTALHNEVADVTEKVARQMGKEYMFISRSDSTLRGHYPLETELLRQKFEMQTGQKIDGEILCPFFPEGGRFTIDDVHYVRYGQELIPASETEFAQDKTFGYQASNMKDYVEEKTGGKYPAKDVVSISLETIHDMDIETITNQLMSVTDFNKVIVNAVSYAGIKVFCVALYTAMKKGKRFMFRTAAGFVKVVGGISDFPLLTKAQMVQSNQQNGGIIVVGSYTKKTTAQLEALRGLEQLRFIELNSDLVVDEAALNEEVDRIVKQEEELLKAGISVVVYTKRTQLVLEGDTKEEILLRSVRISNAVQALVGKLTVCPSFVVAKGGITSNDVGTKALAVQKATAMGQIRPGIPVWQTGEESKFPGIPYVIFPGNVGDDYTLKEAVECLLG
ncbi:MAG: hydroxyacid dehydrogenase [Clostridiales bacterium]|nr:hydroxyacid dehydrogenase [Clostridiales bacterium]MDY3747856.1 four-carbon acid sugar kinase family protein [Lachnospiraceae bacterium]